MPHNPYMPTETVRRSFLTAKECFPENRLVVVKHRPDDPPTPLQPYLEAQNCDPQIIKELVTPKGEWKYRITQPIDPYSESPKQLFATLANMLEPVYEAIDRSLNGSHPYGFNKHGKQHASTVSETGLNLLEATGYDIAVQRRYVAVAAIHDLGNMLSRLSQSFLAPRIFHEIFPNLRFSSADLRIIDRSIQRHDEQTAGWLLFESNKTQNYPPELFALLIADKVDVGRNRLSLSPKNAQATIDKDPHKEVNLLLQTKRAQYNEDVFNWDILYSPEIAKDELEQLYPFAKPHSRKEGYKAYVANDTHNEYRENGTPHFVTLMKKFFDIYKLRVMLVMESAFALRKDTSKFQLSFSDNGTTITLSSTRENKGNFLLPLEKFYSELTYPSAKAPKNSL